MAARQAAEAAGRDGAKAARNHTYSGMSLQEAKQILNVDNLEDVEVIRKASLWKPCLQEWLVICYHMHPLPPPPHTQNYDHLFKINDKSSRGSFYLQSKVRQPSMCGASSGLVEVYTVGEPSGNNLSSVTIEATSSLNLRPFVLRPESTKTLTLPFVHFGLKMHRQSLRTKLCFADIWSSESKCHCVCRL